MWRCPHCGAPQAETARCWVCRRSSTTCSTCRHFQQALGTDGGWCALDAKRLPLTGAEQRGCWQGRVATTAQPPPDIGVAGGRPPGRPVADHAGDAWAPSGIDFIPVELIGPTVAAARPATVDGPDVEPMLAHGLPPVTTDADEPWVERTSLFGDAEA
jgi:hypothetical protein